MSFDLSAFLTDALIASIDNGLIQPDLATVYAGNYLVKSLITQNQITQVSDAIAAYKSAQAAANTSNSDANTDTSNSDSNTDQVGGSN